MTTTPRKRAPAKKAGGQAEAEDGYVVVEQCGMQLRVPIRGKVPYTAYRAFKDGDNDLGTELLLGAEQFAKFLERNPTMDDFEELGAAVQKAAGN